ncbi:MAG: DUF6973 domain-containing protein [Bacillota bacterium]
MFLCFTLLFGILADTSFAKGEEKGDTSDFYIEMHDLLQKYLYELDNGMITVEEFGEKVEANITPFLKDEEGKLALEKSKKVADAENFKGKVAIQGTMVDTSEVSIQAVDKYYGFGSFGVEPEEIAFFALHPILAPYAKTLADQAAESAQYRYKDYTLWQGNGDAYRHAFWSALMTKHIGRTFAYEAGYAHEGLKTGAATSSLDKKMDISNNYQGRIDGTNKNSLSDLQLAEYILDSVSDGDKVRIRVQTSVNYTDIILGVHTKYTGKFVPTSNGGRLH